MLPGDKLLSLISGTLAPCPTEGRAHFFLVPTVDELVQRILHAGRDVKSLTFEEQREWRVCTVRPDGSGACASTGDEMGIALARQLLTLQQPSLLPR